MLVAALLLGALALELVLMLYLGNRAYPDPIRAVRFGRDVASGAISIQTHVDNTKTFLGPVAWYHVWSRAGLAGLHALKLGLMAGTALVQLRLMRGWDRSVGLVALFFLLFYPGTHRNLVPGEVDDVVATLLLAVGVLAYQRTRRPVLAGLVLGVALLFKFWVAIFVGGFLAFLVVERRWRETLVAAVTACVPFLAVDVVFGGAASKALFHTVGVLAHSGWALVGARLLTTGLLPAFLVAGWGALRRPSETRRLFFLLPALYLPYVLVTQDAHAVTFVMTACLVTWSPLIAEVVLDLVRRRVVPALLIAYALVGVAIAVQHLHRDTLEFELGDEVTAPRVGGFEPGEAEAQENASRRRDRPSRPAGNTSPMTPTYRAGGLRHSVDRTGAAAPRPAVAVLPPCHGLVVSRGPLVPRPPSGSVPFPSARGRAGDGAIVHEHPDQGGHEQNVADQDAQSQDVETLDDVEHVGPYLSASCQRSAVPGPAAASTAVRDSGWA